MSNEILDIAARMKELREICEFSPEEMARELNVTPEAYASYESGAIDIPISVLLAMANACHVEPSALLTGGEPKLHVYCLTRAGKGVGIDRRKEYRYKSLAYNFGNTVAEPFLVTAGVVPAGTPLVVNTHEGQEFDYVLTGHMKIVLAGNEVYLGPGDSIYYDSSIPHAMYAVETDCRFIAVVIK